MFTFVIPNIKKRSNFCYSFISRRSSRLTTIKDDEGFFTLVWSNSQSLGTFRESKSAQSDSYAIYVINKHENIFNVWYAGDNFTTVSNDSFTVSYHAPEISINFTEEYEQKTYPVREDKWFLRFCGKTNKIDHRGGRVKSWKSQKGKPQRNYLRR